MRGTRSALALFFVAVSACNAPNAVPGKVLGKDIPAGPSALIPFGSGAPNGIGNGLNPAVGPNCHSTDPNHICLGLKYLVYSDSTGAPTVSSDDAVSNVQGINSVWAQCNLAFQIDRYEMEDPSRFGLVYRTANMGDLDNIRSDFVDDSTLLVVTTGTWNRAGTLGNTGANAWTAMPGGPPYGAVLEKPVGTYSNIIAHELGHYLNLDHVSDQADLMNPIIYDSSTNLYKSQCTTARTAALYYWEKMLR